MTSAGEERRISLRVYRYWDIIRGDRSMPEEADIDPDALGTDWDYCFLLQSRDVANIQDYNFTYLGEGITRAYFDATLDEHNPFLIGPNAFRLSPRFEQVLRDKAPLLDASEFASVTGRTILFRQCLLPIGPASGEIEAIFGAMFFKVIE